MDILNFVTWRRYQRRVDQVDGYGPDLSLPARDQGKRKSGSIVKTQHHYQVRNRIVFQ
jgi:hypothetical protein